MTQPSILLSSLPVPFRKWRTSVCHPSQCRTVGHRRNVSATLQKAFLFKSPASPANVAPLLGKSVLREKLSPGAEPILSLVTTYLTPGAPNLPATVSVQPLSRELAHLQRAMCQADTLVANSESRTFLYALYATVYYAFVIRSVLVN